MSDQCHICGPVRHEAPTVICAPCALLKSFGWDDQEVRRNGLMAILTLKTGAEYGSAVVEGLVVE